LSCIQLDKAAMSSYNVVPPPFGVGWWEDSFHFSD